MCSKARAKESKSHWELKKIRVAESIVPLSAHGPRELSKNLSKFESDSDWTRARESLRAHENFRLNGSFCNIWACKPCIHLVQAYMQGKTGGKLKQLSNVHVAKETGEIWVFTSREAKYWQRKNDMDYKQIHYNLIFSSRKKTQKQITFGRRRYCSFLGFKATK